MSAPETSGIMARIEERLSALKKSERSASIEAFGNAGGIRNLRSGGTRSPGLEFFQKLAPVLDVTPEFLAFGVESEREPIQLPSRPAGNEWLSVIGVVAAGQWREADDAADVSSYEGMRLPADPRFPLTAQYGLGVAGTSLNKLVGDGGGLSCVDIRAARYEPNHGDLIIARRTRYGGQMMEHTAKFYRKNDDGEIELHPYSTDPKHQDPVRLDTDNDDDTEQVTVIGLVTWAHIPVKRDL